jgi:hypothetical protein
MGKNRINAMLSFQRKFQPEKEKNLSKEVEKEEEEENVQRSVTTSRFARRRTRTQYTNSLVTSSCSSTCSPSTSSSSSSSSSTSTSTTSSCCSSPSSSIEVKSKQKKVTFQCDSKPHEIVSYEHDLMSYDELVYLVANLDKKESFSTSIGMNDEVPIYEDEHLFEQNYERSVNLTVAEFLHRSAKFLGYTFRKKSWYPGFRETYFTSNDVKRWRRLARHNWEKEEEERNPKIALKYAISGWINQNSLVMKSKQIWNRRYSDPVSVKKDLNLLVEIINSCVFHGAFQFTQNDIFILCNVQIP